MSFRKGRGATNNIEQGISILSGLEGSKKISFFHAPQPHPNSTRNLRGSGTIAYERRSCFNPLYTRSPARSPDRTPDLSFGSRSPDGSQDGSPNRSPDNSFIKPKENYGFSFGQNVRDKSKMSIRSNRRGSTFQEREAARRLAMKTYQPKKGKIIRYFASKRETEESRQSTEMTTERTQENIEAQKKQKTSHHTRNASEVLEVKQKMKIAYHIEDVFSFKSSNEDVVRNSSKRLGFEIHEMQRNRLSNDTEFALVTILYESGVEDLFPSIRKELILSIMWNSCFVVEKKVSKRLEIDDNFKEKVIDDSSLIIYWVKSIEKNDEIQDNIELLNSYRPPSPIEDRYFWEAVLFAPDVSSDPNEYDIKKFKVKHSNDIRGARFKFLGNNKKEFKVFSVDQLRNKFSTYNY